MGRSVASRLQASAPVFAALGDPLRVSLVLRLSREGPLSIARLTEGTRVSRQAVTKHLGVLASAGLANSRKSGRETIWELNARPLERASDHLDAIARQWDDAIERLRSFVED